MISKKYVVELKSGHAVILVLKKFQRKKMHLFFETHKLHHFTKTILLKISEDFITFEKMH